MFKLRAVHVMVLIILDSVDIHANYPSISLLRDLQNNSPERFAKDFHQSYRVHVRTLCGRSLLAVKSNPSK